MTDILFNEISEQPKVIENLLQNHSGQISRIAQEIDGKFEYILIAARGTSDNAARYAQYLLGSRNKIQVALATPSLYTIYNSPPNIKNALVVGISQSGQSPDIVSVLTTAREQGAKTLSITNNAKSPLAEASDHIIHLDAGEEKAVAATKTYTASLAAMAMLSANLLKNDLMLREFQAIPDQLNATIEATLANINQVNRYRYMEHCVVLGRGFNYSTAFEVALKIKELTQVITAPYSSADFKHGPIATVKKGFPIIVVAPSGKMYDHILAFSRTLLKLGAELIVISDEAEMLEMGQSEFKLSGTIPEWLSPIYSIVPGQMFARQLAQEKGLNIDNPEGLSKVTETF